VFRIARNNYTAFKVKGFNKLSGLVPSFKAVLDDTVAPLRIDDCERLAPSRMDYEFGNGFIAHLFAGSAAKKARRLV
jgi:hypothetical protein